MKKTKQLYLIEVSAVFAGLKKKIPEVSEGLKRVRG
jgi:hypothetical protein